MTAIGEALDRIEAAQVLKPDADDLPPNHTSLDYLQAVYRGQIRAEPSRMRAAIAALQFEHPKLAVQAILPMGDLAERLDRAIERSANAYNSKVIEHRNGGNAKVINGEGSRPKVIEHSKLRRI